jgi:ketosteroid isomerase-like protein
MPTNEARATRSSVEDFARDALRASKDFIHHLWSGDFDWCLSRVSSSFVWVGPQKNDYFLSKDEFSDRLEDLAPQFHRSTPTEEEYSVVACDGQLCGVTSRFLVLTPPDSEKILVQWFRATLVWRRSGRRLTLAHMHISTPIDQGSEVESYPIHAGTETYRYMKSLMKLGSSRKSVSLYDVEGAVHWVHPSQIIYLEANRKRTVVHCMTKQITVPAMIRDTVEMVGDKVIRVHRSYAVNRDHVIELKAGRLLLDDGTSIAIPAKRIADVRAMLTGK